MASQSNPLVQCLVKVDVRRLNSSVEEHSGSIACDLDNWNEYQEGLARLRPWLEGAEGRVAMGLTRPQSVEDAAAELSLLQGWSPMMSLVSRYDLVCNVRLLRSAKFRNFQAGNIYCGQLSHH